MCRICRVINNSGQLRCCNVKELTEKRQQLHAHMQVINKDVRVILDCFVGVPSLFLHADTFSSCLSVIPVSLTYMPDIFGHAHTDHISPWCDDDILVTLVCYN